ncbi:MAG: peptide chain release factor N(5)-glutamine methyltransferase [Firmicutes bacterium]|nr:peptide chain release factor N(5)-glutamine methyltransferase [Bacillota bacterium]
MRNLTLREELVRAARFLNGRGVSSPGLDAEVLLAHVLGRDRVYLYRESQRYLDGEAARRYRALLKRRAGGEPVAYLTGRKEFMGLDFIVGPPVLIPRPETELLVENALAALAGSPGHPAVVDVGTGSGAVAVSLARLASRCAVYATDISAEALMLARENAARHGVAVEFFHGDLLSPLRGVLEPGSVAVITANLPYIPKEELSSLPREVRDYEPRTALDGGFDGLEPYRRLVPVAAQYLAPGGMLLMEISPDQAERALALALPPRWESAPVPDLAGRTRLVKARLKQ